MNKDSFYYLTKRILYALYRTLFRIEYTGLENIPKNNRYIMCPNHISNYDPPGVVLLLKHRIYFMAKSEAFNTFSAPILKYFGAYSVNRSTKDRKALTTTMKLLRDGKPICIFPEGTRSKTGVLGEGKSGAATFALKTHTPVIPVAITGNYRLFNKIKVTYGKPIILNNPNEKTTSEVTLQATQEIMSSIEHLIKTNQNHE